MINLQLSCSSRVARASHSSEPSASVASLPMTNVERRAKEPLDTNRTWEPPDEQKLAQYAEAPQPNALKTSKKESGTTHQFHDHAEPSDNGSVPQPEEEITGEATALHQVTVAIQPPVQATASPASSTFAQPAPPVDPIGEEPQQPPAHLPQASLPVADTTTLVKARPPLPTALPCAQSTPPTEPKTGLSQGQEQADTLAQDCVVQSGSRRGVGTRPPRNFFITYYSFGTGTAPWLLRFLSPCGLAQPCGC